MKPLAQYHPLTNFIFFLMVILLTGIIHNPLLTLISCLSGIITFYASKNKEDHSFGPIFVLCLLAGILNPIFSHHGVTILFYLQGRPFTLEACIYGIYLSMQLLQLITWFKIFSLCTSSEHLMCLFGIFSPRLALLFSMVLRFVPQFTGLYKSTENAARLLGRYRSDNIISTVISKVRVFLSVSGYALEKGIVTADSMEARGYSLPQRSSAGRFKIRRRDIILMTYTLSLSVTLIWAKILKIDETLFYPRFVPSFTWPGLLLVLLPGLLLTLIPLITYLPERRH